MVLDANIWVQDVLVATGVPLLLYPLSRQSREIRLLILTHAYARLYISLYETICVYIMLNMSSCWCITTWIILDVSLPYLQSPTPIVRNCCGSHHLPPMRLTVQFQHVQSGFRVIKLDPRDQQLLQQEYSSQVQPFVPLVYGPHCGHRHPK